MTSTEKSSESVSQLSFNVTSGISVCISCELFSKNLEHSYHNVISSASDYVLSLLAFSGENDILIKLRSHLSNIRL